MLDHIKAKGIPQFNWYTCWTSLGTNGMPDKLIKEGLKQPDWIKISFEKGSKNITGHVAPDQARKYFLAFMHPDFKSKILTWLSEAKKEDDPTLFNLMGQCFHDVDLTKSTNVSGPTLLVSDAPMIPTSWRRTLMSVSGITSMQLPGSQTLATYWFVGFALPRSPCSWQCISLCHVECSSPATFTAANSVKRWSCPQHKKKANKSSLCSPRRIS